MTARLLVDLALAVAVLVVVPLGHGLHPGRRWSPLWLVPGGVVAVVALLAPPGNAPGVAALAWVLVAVVVAVDAVRAWAVAPTLRGPGVTWPVAALYLVVGALWLAVDRFGLEPLGVAQPFVVLTAVHFHYAGFATTTLAGRAWRRRPDDRLAAVAAWLVMAAPPVVALGFTLHGAMQVVGAVVLTAGLWLLAWVVLVRVVPTLPRGAGVSRSLLVVSALSVVVPMGLAVHWAAGTNLGFAVLSIRAMALAHGAVNALGFALAGLLGWHLLDDDAVTGPSSPVRGPPPRGASPRVE